MRQEVRDARGGPGTVEEVGRIGNRIWHQLGGRLLDFWLEVDDAGLVLHGLARTYYAKQLAQHAVMAATDLPILRNEIEVL